MSYVEVYTKTDTMSRVLDELYADKWASQGGTVESIIWRDEHITTSEEKKKIEDKFKELEGDTKLDNLRYYRDKLLRETDWMSLPDAPTMSDAWKKYRQELRDITKTYKTLDDVKWPTKPS